MKNFYSNYFFLYLNRMRPIQFDIYLVDRSPIYVQSSLVPFHYQFQNRRNCLVVCDTCTNRIPEWDRASEFMFYVYVWLSILKCVCGQSDDSFVMRWGWTQQMDSGTNAISMFWFVYKLVEIKKKKSRSRDRKWCDPWERDDTPLPLTWYRYRYKRSNESDCRQ